MSLRDSSTYCRIGSGSLKKYRYRGSGIWKFEKSNAVAVLYTIKIWSFFLGVYHFRLSHILSDHWILPNTAIYYSCNWITTFSQPLRTAYLNQLVNLSISSNRLTSIPPGAFQGLTSLESSFPTTHQGPFSALSDIIPALVSLISLRFLLLSENMLSQVDNTDFASMRNSSLKTLELINCIISGMLALKASCLSRIWNGSVQFRNSCGSARPDPHNERERTQSIGSVSVSFAVQWCNKFCLLRTSKNWICPRTLCRGWAQKSFLLYTAHSRPGPECVRNHQHRERKVQPDAASYAVQFGPQWTRRYPTGCHGPSATPVVQFEREWTKSNETEWKINEITLGVPMLIGRVCFSWSRWWRPASVCAWWATWWTRLLLFFLLCIFFQWLLFSNLFAYSSTSTCCYSSIAALEFCWDATSRRRGRNDWSSLPGVVKLKRAENREEEKVGWVVEGKQGRLRWPV